VITFIKKVITFIKRGAVSKAASRPHCEEERRSNPVIIRHFRIASLRSQSPFFKNLRQFAVRGDGFPSGTTNPKER
jgi:hypothetical protein